MMQNAKGPAATAIAPDHGSNLTYCKDQKMNATSNIIEQSGAPEAPSAVRWTKIGDVMDILATVRHLNEVLFLAAAGLGDMNHTNAIQAVVDEIESKLLAADDRLEEIKEALA